MARLFLIALLAFVQTACAAPPAAHRAVSYTHEVRQNPPLHLHILTVDLTDPAVTVVVRPGGPAPKDAGVAPGNVPWQTTLMTPRAIAERDGLYAVVNGDFFATRDTREIFGRKVAYFDNNPARVVGYAMSDGQPWSTSMDKGHAALCVQGKRGISIHAAPRNLPADVTQTVGGNAIVVQDGKVIGGGKDRAPRTCAGIDKDGKRLVLLVADGRKLDYSVGLTGGELGQEMLRLGCHTAINLDGGGSSSMSMRDPASGQIKLLSHPSDGHDFVIPLSVERPVANVLGIRIEEPAKK